MPRPDQKRSRAFTGTWFGLTAAKRAFFKTVKCEYVVVQVECCPDTGRLHYQWFIWFTNAKSLACVRRMMPGAHVEVCNNKQASIEYCQKADSRLNGAEGWAHVRGNPPGQGKLDVRAMQHDILVAKLTDMEMYLKYGTGWHHQKTSLRELRMAARPPRTAPTKTIYCHGRSGHGKSHFIHHAAYALDPNYGVFGFQHNGSTWFDTCESPILVIEDFVASDIKGRHLLRLTDKWKGNVQVKFGTMSINFTHIFISSNTAPDKLYPDMIWTYEDGPEKGDPGPLHRRLTTMGSCIREFKEKWREPHPYGMGNVPELANSPVDDKTDHPRDHDIATSQYYAFFAKTQCDADIDSLELD